MNIIGPDELVFGVDDLDGCTQYLLDYGLSGIDLGSRGGRFEALDGTAVVLRRAGDPGLATAIGPAPSIRETVYGVADAATLEEIGAELGRDREVRRAVDGSLHTVDDLGFALGFQVTCRRPFSAAAALSNAPGHPPQRAPNQLGADPNAVIVPRTLSHVVYFVPDAAKAEAFYTQRLKFTTTDRFTGVGPFMRPAGSKDHHTLFMIQTPPFMQGVEHLAFHLGSANEVLQMGTRFAAKGYQSFWGPGRHILGSNWFWYFNSPLGCHVEYDADMDVHDDAWVAREIAISADTSQLFLFGAREKWLPGGGRA